jgi:hypothetical protein
LISIKSDNPWKIMHLRNDPLRYPQSSPLQLCIKPAVSQDRPDFAESALDAENARTIVFAARLKKQEPGRHNARHSKALGAIMKEQPKDLRNEADIGSGEKTPGEHETEKMIEQVGNPAGKPKEGASDPAGAGRPQPPGSNGNR